MQAFVETPAGGLTDPDKMLAQLGPMLATLPDDQAAAAAFAVANQYARLGQWTLAREAFLLMVDRYPAHPASADAYRWLVRYNSSSEAKRRQDLIRFGQYNRPWLFKDPASLTQLYRVLMPIPLTQLGTNPKLVQNAGY